MAEPAAAGPAPADTYTHGHHDSVLRSHRWRTAENSAAHLLPHLRPGLRVLDVGCGPGTVTADLARRVAPGPVLGIDRSPGVLEEARGRPDLPDNVRFDVGDVYALDHPDDSFDVVHAHQVLQHLSDPVAALREMRRVCRPGGVVAARDGDYGAFTWAPGDERLDAWLALYRSVARANGAEPDAGRHLLGWAQAAGFAEVTPSASVWCHATPGERAWWASLWADRLRYSDLAAQALAGGHATRPSWRPWPTGSRRGRPGPTAGSPSSTARSWPAPDLRPRARPPAHPPSAGPQSTGAREAKARARSILARRSLRSRSPTST